MTPAHTSTIDVFDDAVLLDPYPYLRELRDTGAAVKLEHHDVWFVGRYLDVKNCLADPETFSAHRGVGLAYQFNRLAEGTGILSTEGPQHQLLRRILMRDLNTRRLRSVQTQVHAQAHNLVGGLVKDGHFDAVTDLARVFPLSVVCAFLGLPTQDRELILTLADAGINSFGPLNERTLRGFPEYHRLLRYLSSVAVPPNLLPGGAGKTIYQAVDGGEITETQAAALISAYLVAGIDTTINSVSNSLHQLSQHSDQWTQLRAEPDKLIPQVLLEVIRYDPPVQMMTRTVTRDVLIDEVPVRAGERVLLSYASACRDERQYPEPDRFDIHRNPRDHLGFGHGEHNCVGSGLARLETTAVLRAMVAHVESYTCGEPERHLNNVVRGLASLPVTITATASLSGMLDDFENERGQAVPAALGCEETSLEPRIRSEFIHKLADVAPVGPQRHPEAAGRDFVLCPRDEEFEDVSTVLDRELGRVGRQRESLRGSGATSPVGQRQLGNSGHDRCPFDDQSQFLGTDRPYQGKLPVDDHDGN